MDKSKFTKVTFCALEKASKLVNDPFFHSLDEFSDKTFEVNTKFATYFRMCNKLLSSTLHSMNNVECIRLFYILTLGGSIRLDKKN